MLDIHRDVAEHPHALPRRRERLGPELANLLVPEADRHHPALPVGHGSHCAAEILEAPPHLRELLEAALLRLSDSQSTFTEPTELTSAADVAEHQVLLSCAKAALACTSLLVSATVAAPMQPVAAGAPVMGTAASPTVVIQQPVAPVMP